MQKEEVVGAIMSERGSRMKISKVLKTGLIEVIDADRPIGSYGSVYKRASQNTYDGVYQSVNGSWCFKLPTPGKEKDRIGSLRFATLAEKEAWAMVLKRQEEEFAQYTKNLKRWLPDLSDEEAQRIAKKPRLEKRAATLEVVKNGEEFVDWLLSTK